MWPIVLGMPILIIIGILLSSVVLPSLENHGTDDRGQAIVGIDALLPILGFILISVTVTVVILSILKWFLKNRKKTFFHYGGVILGGYIWIGVFVGGLVMLLAASEFASFKPVVQNNKQIEVILQNIGADDKLLEGVSTEYVKSFPDSKHNTLGTYQPVFSSDGWFSYGTISIKQGIDKPHINTVVAHEYVHHVWAAHLDEATKRKLASEVITLYGKDSWMQQRVDSYSTGHILDSNELFAFYCTEVPDAHLTQAILSQCNNYINRSKLTNL